jgi:hypothetical protein
MRIVYTISALAVLIAIVLLVLAALAGEQVNNTRPEPSTGLVTVLRNYETNNNPMQPGGILLSPSREFMFLFTDNLYVIQLGDSSENRGTILWSALSTSTFPYTAFMTLSANATLEVQIVNDEGTLLILWSNDLILETTDNYYLQVTDTGDLQIVASSSSGVVWNTSSELIYSK